MIAASGVARVPNANPLFQVLFQYLPEGRGRAVMQLAGGSTKPLEKAAGLSHAKLDLTFSVGGKGILAEYMSELFDAVTMERLAGSFVSRA